MMYEKMCQLLVENHLLAVGADGVVVAVSGGADSLALLHGLRQFNQGRMFKLVVATFDHRLRGQAGADDAAYVADLARQWGLPVVVGAAEAEAYEAKGLGVEQQARLARYRFLAQVAREHDITNIAVGHQQDDQAETVLMHMIRGAGLPGLCGMSVKDALPGSADLWVVRPLLTCTRAEIEAYCAEQGLQPRWDATNDDLRLQRNFLRKQVLPVLRQMNPQISQTLAQMADRLAYDEDFLAATVLDILNETLIENGTARIRRNLLRSLHITLARRWLLEVGEILRGAGDAPDYAHIITGLQIGLHKATGKVALLGHGLQLRVEKDWIVVEIR